MITTLSQLIATAESANFVGAIRFEPGFHPTQKNCLRCVKANAPMSYMTAETLCASSIGLYQIMLENVYDLGYAGSVLDFWQSPEIQLEYFDKYLDSRNINFSLNEILEDQKKRELFAKKYNGAIVYADRLVKIFEANKE